MHSRVPESRAFLSQNVPDLIYHPYDFVRLLAPFVHPTTCPLQPAELLDILYGLQASQPLWSFGFPTLCFAPTRCIILARMATCWSIFLQRVEANRGSSKGPPGPGQCWVYDKFSVNYLRRQSDISCILAHLPNLLKT